MDEGKKDANGVTSISCPNCNRLNSKDNYLCIYCGTSLISGSSHNDVIQPVSSTVYHQTEIKNQDLKNENKEQITNVEEKAKEEPMAKVEATTQTESSDFIICSKCGGNIKSGSNFCTHCGAALSSDSNGNQSVNQENNESKSPIPIIFAILSVIISAFFPPAFIIAIIFAIISLFKKEYRSFGITVFTAFGVVFLTGALFVIIMFGMCIAALGG